MPRAKTKKSYDLEAFHNYIAGVCGLGEESAELKSLEGAAETGDEAEKIALIVNLVEQVEGVQVGFMESSPETYTSAALDRVIALLADVLNEYACLIQE